MQEPFGFWGLFKGETSNLLTLVGRNSKVTIWVISCIFQTVLASLAKILSSEEQEVTCVMTSWKLMALIVYKPLSNPLLVQCCTESCW